MEVKAPARTAARGRGRGDRLGDLDVEAADLRRVRRVGLDERSAPLRVPAPAQDRRRR
jgi:hypothetical protein